ncbi:BioY family transporter [Alteribacter lacisalsi]|jgi:biotin transport system substrate-specific component|uniref:Biotin transporter n=1 Tax=Alteribacter lacisalsi TaxID=2045244 RepID=A0A2W0H6H2_9BACI|nr:ECF transporter S component [Alteribacter lacisalsi]PYZ95710.1 BioY family transporter [Alteribacter lacisalsi]
MTTQKSRTRLTARDITKAAMFIALMAAGANATAFITIGTVPMTFQAFVAILAGILLGSRLGAFSMTGYAVLGLIGAPVFAQFTGTAVVVSPTFGFVLSYILMAFVSGLIIEKSSRKPGAYMTASFTAIAICYVFGYTYFYFFFSLSAGSTLSAASYFAILATWLPFIIKDLIMSAVAAAIAPRIDRAVNPRSRGRRPSTAA